MFNVKDSFNVTCSLKVQNTYFQELIKSYLNIKDIIFEGQPVSLCCCWIYQTHTHTHSHLLPFIRSFSLLLIRSLVWLNYIQFIFLCSLEYSSLTLSEPLHASLNRNFIETLKKWTRFWSIKGDVPGSTGNLFYDWIKSALVVVSFLFCIRLHSYTNDGVQRIWIKEINSFHDEHRDDFDESKEEEHRDTE